LRILHVLKHTGRLNGNVHAAIDLACEQRRLGNDVAVCSGGGSFDALLASNGVEVIVVGQGPKALTSLAATARLVRLVLRWRPDVVHAHMMTSAILAWPACQFSRVPLITTVHNEFQKSAILMGLGKRVIAVSQAVGRSMEKRGIPASRIRVVLNGTIGAARLEAMDRTPKKLSRPSVVFLGGLHPRKGVSDLLEAFSTVHARFPTAHLTIIGEGPYLAEYENMANSLDGTVTFAGSQENPRSYLLAADIFVLPSRNDPAPLVISEAREARCAIVATDVDGIPELLEFGKAGILVPPSDPPRLGAAISSLIESQDTLALWRQNSQINIERLGIDRVARDTIGVYNEVV
jgi:glycosyltransferase involved in cell wall biosynthesis